MCVVVRAFECECKINAGRKEWYNSRLCRLSGSACETTAELALGNIVLLYASASGRRQSTRVCGGLCEKRK